MSILKYKDPKTGEFKRINPYKADLSFVGKDGITIDKAADSEKIEISGSGLVQKDTRNTGLRRAYTVNESGIEQVMMTINVDALPTNIYSLVRRDGNVSVHGLVPDSPTDTVLLNKKYVDDNYVKKVKFANLEQALNGYILDTTKEAYADLDSAVLKDNVTVGDNVYPIADKTRALVSRIEGKTTKMVQLLDKSKFPATTTTKGVTFTNNGDGTITVNGTVTEDNHAFILIQGNIECIANHKYLIIGCPEGGLAGKTYGIRGQSLGNPIIWDEGKGNIFSFTSLTVITFYLDFYTNDATYTNKVVTPQLFDLTAMNREDITTVEQFKAEFPELYPYENGNIYPAKISGVKFTGKNLLKLKLSSTNKCTANIEDDVLKITPTTSNAGDIVFAEVKTHLKAGEYVLSSISENQNTTPTQFIVSKGQYGENNITTIFPKGTKFTLDSESDIYILIYPCLHSALPFKAMSVQIQIQAGTAPTAYEPYIDPVSVTLPETYDLHGIGDYKDYLEIIKNENNELYTLKKVQQIEKKVLDGTETVNKSEYVTTNYQLYYIPMILLNVNNGLGGICNKLPTAIHTEDIAHITFGINNVYPYLFLDKETYTTEDSVKAYLAAQYAANDPLIIYYIRQTPVETVIATNLTYEQVTAIRHNGGLIEVEGNINKGYARPTVTNTIVYRLTAANTAEV
mgnify:CR=1 FL=1|nr:MAG TPA: hypothetical protein [Caudoviricetes sp.]